MGYVAVRWRRKVVWSWGVGERSGVELEEQDWSMLVRWYIISISILVSYNTFLSLMKILQYILMNIPEHGSIK